MEDYFDKRLKCKNIAPKQGDDVPTNKYSKKIKQRPKWAKYETDFST